MSRSGKTGRVPGTPPSRRRAWYAAFARPVLPDLLIGAHALHRADRLLTWNADDFSDFPALDLITY